MDVERSIENIHLSENQFLSIVQKAFPECGRVDSYKLLSGGALNTTYKFQIKDQSFVLRLYVRDRALCKMEKEIHALIDGKVSTPKLIYLEENHPFFPYAIFQFIEGSHISEVPWECKNSLSYDLGKLLASIHAFTFPVAGLFGEGISIGKPFKVGSSPYFEEAFSLLSKEGFARARLGDKLSEQMLEFMQRNKDFFPKVEGNICLTHSDFKPVNLLYSLGKSFVLDWEFAHAGMGLLDFAILLRHKEQFPLDLGYLVNGYTDFGGKLPDEWLRSSLITDFINIVSMLDAPPERPKLFHQLKSAAQSTIDHWDFFTYPTF
ncbi:MAG: aminoglycoside phosphotransferase family protein [Rhabdochlamydiaceae bacterium]|nr:aminoglycoside phosphotransferase family protein [Rhabdochlamydiaceae bacterium]